LHLSKLLSFEVFIQLKITIVDRIGGTLIGFSRKGLAKANSFLALILQLKLEAIQKPFITQH